MRLTYGITVPAYLYQVHERGSKLSVCVFFDLLKNIFTAVYYKTNNKQFQLVSHMHMRTKLQIKNKTYSASRQTLQLEVPVTNNKTCLHLVCLFLVLLCEALHTVYTHFTIYKIFRWFLDIRVFVMGTFERVNI